MGRMPLPIGWTGHEVYQTVLNDHEIPPRAAQNDMAAVRVRARVVWSDDGEETIDGHSDAYSGRLVLVHTRDRRLHVRSVWLDVDDVNRVNP
jgi:hypothetical protein